MIRRRHPREDRYLSTTLSRRAGIERLHAGGLAMANSALPVFYLGREDTFGTPGTSIAYIGVPLAVVFSFCWLFLFSRFGQAGGFAGATLGFPYLMALLMIQGAGWLPDIDMGFYVFWMGAIAVVTAAIASITCAATIKRWSANS